MSILSNVAFRALDVQIELETNLIAVSEDKQRLAIANKVNRLRQCERYTKASQKALEFIVKNSSDSVLDELMNYKCAYTARNIIQYAVFMTDSKRVSMITKIEDTVKYLSNNNAVVSTLYARTLNNDSGRDSKILKTMQFFNLIEIKNKTFRDAISKDDAVLLISN